MGSSAARSSPEQGQNRLSVEALPVPRPDQGPGCLYLREATADDLANLRHVRGNVPAIVWLVVFTGAAQRFAYYGSTVPWRRPAP